jgi:MFS transporter, PAT family, beta-lactamase induction signal transducer AmpG
LSSAPRSAQTGWRALVPAPVRQYTEPAPLAALFLGISSGAPYAMIVATLTTRLAQYGIDKRAITAFSLAVLVYNLKWLWAWVLDGVRLPVIGKLGQRVSWLLVIGVLVIVAIVDLALADPSASLASTARAAIFVAFAGATYDIVIDAYRIESLEPRQLGVGSGMSQYGWRIGSAAAGAVALVIAARASWTAAYIACAAFALPAMVTCLILGEPPRHRPPAARANLRTIVDSVVAPLIEFFRRRGAMLVLLFVLLHKIGDTLANLTFRLLFDSLGYTNDEIAAYDVGFGFWAYLAGVFLGGVLYERLGMKRSVLVSLLLMCVSNLSFAGLAAAGHSNWGLAGSIGFENLASGIGGVTVVAYFSALCDLRYTASQYALISAAASVIGRVLTGATAGALIEQLGYVGFYVFTTVIAVPGIVLFWLLIRWDLVGADDNATGAAARESGRAEISQS